MMSKIAKFDLFTNPFQYTFSQNKKSKQTFLGGLTSLIVLIVSQMYLGYLLYLYFDNKMQPTILTLNNHYSDSFQMNFTSNLIAFQMKVGSLTMQDMEKRDGKKYLTMLASHNIFDNSGNLNQTIYRTLPCTEEELLGYFCIDYSSQATLPPYMPFTYRPEDFFTEQFLVYFAYCSSDFETPDVVCATPDEINQNIFTQITLILFKYKTQEYNPQTKSLENRIRSEFYRIQNDLVVTSQISFNKSIVKVSEGILIQSENSQDYISGYIRQDSYNSFQYLQQHSFLNVYLQMVYLISGDSSVQRVQFSQVTTVLAQFTSIFNMLLFLGLVSRVFAQSEILHDFIELQLKVYFKKTALEIMAQSKKVPSGLSQIGSPVNNSQANFSNQDQKFNLSSTNRINKNMQYGDMGELHKQMQSMDFKKVLGGYMNVGIFRRIKYFIQSSIFGLKENHDDRKEIKVYKSLIQQSQKSMSIFELQKEVMTIKMMLRMLLSVEQYAAMQLCGAGILIKEKPAEQINITQIKQELPIAASSVDQDEGIFNSMDISEHRQKQCSIKFKSRQSMSLEKPDVTITGAKQQLENQIMNKVLELQSPTGVVNRKQPSANHLEKIDLLETDQSYFDECLGRFISNNHILINEKRSLESEIDKRIIDCMIQLNSFTTPIDSLSKITPNNKDLK